MVAQYISSSLFFAALALAAPVATPAAHADDPVEVRMLDRGPDGQPKAFSPALLEIEPGTTVDFVAWDFGHDLVSIDDLRPAGSEAFSAPKNAGTLVTFETEGVYVYQCAAHRTMGMVGVIVVGDPTVNLDAIRAAIPEHAELSENGRERLNALLDRIGTAGAPAGG